MSGLESEEHAGRLSALLTQVLASQENERRGITRTLQEEIGQLLAALALRLRVAEQTSDPARQTALVTEARGLAADVLREIETLVRRLYPPALDSQGLGPALEFYAQDFARQAQIEVELNLEILPDRLPAHLELTLFRIAQEALENVRSHAYASQVQILLYKLDNQICLHVQDNGIGYAPGSLMESTFFSMAQRAELAGGHCEFRAVQGEGAQVEVKIPLGIEESPS